MGKAVDTYYQTYDKFLWTGDFNAEDTEPGLTQFLCEYDAIVNLVNEKKPISKAKISPVVLTFLSQILLIVFKIH